MKRATRCLNVQINIIQWKTVINKCKIVSYVWEPIYVTVCYRKHLSKVFLFNCSHRGSTALYVVFLGPLQMVMSFQDQLTMRFF